jgi:HAE1 family hydrophobic/amphiphilic exporter-1
VIQQRLKNGFLLVLALGLMGWTGFFPGAKAFAEEKGIKILTLEEARRIALEKNKDIQKAREYRNLVEGRYIEERSAALPRLQLSGTIFHNRDESQKAYGFPAQQESQTRSVEIGLSQALYTFGQVGAAIRAAKVGLTTADDQLKIFQQAAIRDVSSAFYDILLARELYTLAGQTLEQKIRHLDEAQRKYAAGIATEYDVLAAQVAVENARPEVIRKENLIRTSREKFRFLLGLEGQEVDVKGTIEPPFVPYPQYEEAVQTAWENRPELSDQHKRVEIGRELVKIYDAGDKPRLDFKASYGWRELILGADKGDGQAWTAGLFLSFPFFDGMRSSGKVAQAKSDVATLKIEEAKLKDSISLQVRDAVNACREAGEIVKALAGTVKQAERLLFMAEKGYEYGVKTKLDVDDAELNLTQAKGNMVRARRDYLVALVTFDWVKGTLGEKVRSDSFGVRSKTISEEEGKQLREEKGRGI